MMEVVFRELTDDFGITLDTYISGQPYADYTGPYDVTPRITSQKLKTADMHLLNDVLIYTIPTREEYNPSGGSTFIIGG